MARGWTEYPSALYLGGGVGWTPGVATWLGTHPCPKKHQRGVFFSYTGSEEEGEEWCSLSSGGAAIWIVSLQKGKAKIFHRIIKNYTFPMKPHSLHCFIAKRVISILDNLRYLRFKLLKYKENNKKICNIFIITPKIFPNEKGIITKVLFCIIRWCPYFKIVQKIALNPFCDKSLRILK